MNTTEDAPTSGGHDLFDGEYEPSPVPRIREQVALYEVTDGTKGGHLAYSQGVGVDTTTFLDRRGRNDARHADADANTSEPASLTDTG